MELRQYQQEAVDTAIDWVRKSVEPCLIEAAVGAGKTFIIAAIAEKLRKLSGKKILCSAPSAELVKQNKEKYLLTGQPCSVYSSSAGSKDLRHDVVFATPGTFKRVARLIGHQFSAIILDEADAITPTLKGIIEDLKDGNPNIRVIGLTGTPFRTGDGYIFRVWPDGKANTDQQAIDPYFSKLIYRITAGELISNGFLTPPVVLKPDEYYNTSELKLNKFGKFDEDAIRRTFEGQGRITSQIVKNVVERSAGRNGVMFFGATVQHCHEIAASLPREYTRIVTGETPIAERNKIISDFKQMKFPYIINMNVLAVGFDAPHVSVIAVLRATESVRLLQQIAGRGTRLHESKKDFLFLDYADNINRHGIKGNDLFNPKIKTKVGGGDSVPIDVTCPQCQTKLEFTARKNEENYDIDENGYFTLHGMRIETEHGPMPAHYGRRCYGLVPVGNGQLDQCSYRWTSKPCPSCHEPNDIAARYCINCKEEIVDPNDKLIADFKAAKKDPDRIQTDRLLSFNLKDTVTQSGRECKLVDFTTEYRNFRVWYMPDRKEFRAFMKATQDGTRTPESITYKKEPGKIFYRVLAFDLEIDTPENIVL